MKQLLFLILLVGLFSCKKETPGYTTKQYTEFEYEKLSNFKNYRMFTKLGEINDASLVARYANTHSQFFYTPSSEFTGNEYKRFSFVNEDSIINTGIAPVGEMKRTLVDAYDVFKSKYTVPVNDTNTLELHLGKYKLHYLETTSLGYSYFELYDPAIILKRVNDKLHLPIIRYIITSTQDYSFSFSTGRFNNVLDPTGINKLGDKDTLLVQSFDIILQKK
ncbi:hypothetical protein [Aridibaculum aurantiacum]|uniref:hypothetical protein n=1 Tax=Aridibaculum aurantiacum TaxID=2810307 RepID=UPI001A976311|nr:hypothetical protein [Aridibaculum aurantiacum]